MAPRVSLVKDINFIQNLISAEPKAKVVKATRSSLAAIGTGFCPQIYRIQRV
jgi:hypothetical protein